VACERKDGGRGCARHRVEPRPLEDSRTNVPPRFKGQSKTDDKAPFQPGITAQYKASKAFLLCFVSAHPSSLWRGVAAARRRASSKLMICFACFFRPRLTPCTHPTHTHTHSTRQEKTTWTLSRPHLERSSRNRYGWRRGKREEA